MMPHITGLAFCVGSAVVQLAHLVWAILKGRREDVGRREVLATIWIAAGIVIGSLS